MRRSVMKPPILIAIGLLAQPGGAAGPDDDQRRIHFFER
jgi:hypothetical protein